MDAKKIQEEINNKENEMQSIQQLSDYDQGASATKVVPKEAWFGYHNYTLFIFGPDN